MNALAKWLAKYADDLTPLQREAAGDFVRAQSALQETVDVSNALSAAAPKQARDITWLYGPDIFKGRDRWITSRSKLNESFGPDQDILTQRDQRLRELLHMLGEEDAYANIPYTAADTMKFRYRTKE